MQPPSFENESDPSFEGSSVKDEAKSSKYDDRNPAPGHVGKFIPVEEEAKEGPEKEEQPEKASSRPSAEHAHSDKPSKVDSLHRQHYIKALAALITCPETEIPLTLGIYGPWGSGKSSFMLQLREMISPKVSSVEFNPWRYNDPSSLWFGLISEVAMALDKEFTPWDRLRLLLLHKPSGHIHFLKKMKKRATAAAKKVHNWVTGTLAFFGIAQPETLTKPLHNVMEILGVVDADKKIALFKGTISPESLLMGAGALCLMLGWLVVKMWYGWKHPFLSQIEANRISGGNIQSEFKQMTFDELDLIRDLLKGAMQKKKGQPLRIGIFLDDLDRCSPDRVVEVLEAVHLCLEGLPFVTVLGMDSRVVSHAVASRFEFMLEDEASSIEKEAYGQYFLQKIVHIPFQLPPPWVYEKYIKRLMGASRPEHGSGPAMDDEPDTISVDQQDLEHKMEIAQQEMELLNPFVKDLKASPRSVKCLINQYRLAKAINSQLDESRRLEPERLFCWLVLFQNWPKWGSVLFGEVEKDLTFLDQMDPKDNKLKGYPMSMVQYIIAYRGLLAEVVGRPGGLEFTRCFSFLAPEGPLSVSQAPGSDK